MKPIVEATTRVASKNFSRKFVAIGKIVNEWPAIMGQSFADKATPSKIHYRKPAKKNDRPSAILEIATTSADATLLHYQKGVILERLQHLFGEAWITDIKFIVAERLRPLTPTQKKYHRPLTHAEKKDLSDTLGTVQDAEMRARLESLGTSILRH